MLDARHLQRASCFFCDEACEACNSGPTPGTIQLAMHALCLFESARLLGSPVSCSTVISSQPARGNRITHHFVKSHGRRTRQARSCAMRSVGTCTISQLLCMRCPQSAGAKLLHSVCAVACVVIWRLMQPSPLQARLATGGMCPAVELHSHSCDAIGAHLVLALNGMHAIWDIPNDLLQGSGSLQGVSAGQVQHTMRAYSVSVWHACSAAQSIAGSVRLPQRVACGTTCTDHSLRAADATEKRTLAGVAL